MGLLNEDFLDNMDNRSVLSDEEVEVGGEVKSPQDYPFMLEFRVSWFSYNNSPEKFMARLNSLSKAHFIKSMSIESDLKDEERGKKGAYLNFYVGFEPDFKNMKNIL